MRDCACTLVCVQTKGPMDRRVQINIACDPTADPPVIGAPYEDPNRP